jgi:hypothetical protein
MVSPIIQFKNWLATGVTTRWLAKQNIARQPAGTIKKTDYWRDELTRTATARLQK